MSTRIAGTDKGVSITRYSRGRDLGYGYQVTWVKKSGQIDYLSFTDEQKARDFYHLIFSAIEIA